jgi:hypothetical protein
MFNTFLAWKSSVKVTIRSSRKARRETPGLIEDEQMNNLARGRRVIELSPQDADTREQGRENVQISLVYCKNPASYCNGRDPPYIRHAAMQQAGP